MAFFNSFHFTILHYHCQFPNFLINQTIFMFVSSISLEMVVIYKFLQSLHSNELPNAAVLGLAYFRLNSMVVWANKGNLPYAECPSSEGFPWN